jgi:hypothetical protein
MLTKTNKIFPIINSDGNVSEDSKNKTFCMAPWSHTFLSPQGERRLCCASREEHSFQRQYIDLTNNDKLPDEPLTSDDFHPKTLEEHWNSSYMRGIRKKLMAGETIPQCEVCNTDEYNMSNYRRWFNVLFHDKITQAFENTDDTGHTTMPVISFDYRVSNLCNFKCRMCGEQLSSSWEAESKKHKRWDEKTQPFMIPAIKKKMQNFQIEVAEQEFLQAVESGIVEEIYWAGGEPLMYDIHWDIMKIMVANGSSKNCIVRYNTNLSRTQFKGIDFYNLLPDFKDWQVCASIDAVGKNVEFIRKGIVWEEWLSNFKRGVQLPNGHKNMIIDLTITAPGMFDIVKLFELALELDVKIETKIVFAFHPDKIISPFAWPKHILHRHINSILEYVEPRATEKQQSLVSVLKSMLVQQTFEERWPNTYKEEFTKGKALQKYLDKIRNESYTYEDIYSIDAELLEWWNRI